MSSYNYKDNIVEIICSVTNDEYYNGMPNEFAIIGLRNGLNMYKNGGLRGNMFYNFKKGLEHFNNIFTEEDKKIKVTIKPEVLKEYQERKQRQLNHIIALPKELKGKCNC